MVTEKAMCLWCGRHVKVTDKGKMQYHKAAGGRKCSGSGQPPEIGGPEKFRVPFRGMFVK